MIERNSFKLLAQEEEKLHIPPPDLEEDIFNQLHILSIFGKTVEMYLPGAINLFVEFLIMSLILCIRLFQICPFDPAALS